MKLVQPYCDISVLIEAQAWENYCNALHMSRVCRAHIDRYKYTWIAERSLDRYFECLEAKAKRAQRWPA